MKHVLSIVNIKMLDSDTIDELIEAMKLFDSDKSGLYFLDSVTI